MPTKRNRTARAAKRTAKADGKRDRKLRAGGRAEQPGAVRIIGGEWRRRRIAIPEGVDLRPTPDRVRETLFNWLAPVLPGARCLDLFAGTGVLGFEALSRGAASAVLVERDLRAAGAIETQREVFAANATVVAADARVWVRDSGVAPFDIVFVDPPYADAVDDLLAVLPRLLKPDSRVYLERERASPWPAAVGFEWLRRGSAGAVAFGLAAYGPAHGRAVPDRGAAAEPGIEH